MFLRNPWVRTFLRCYWLHNLKFLLFFFLITGEVERLLREYRQNQELVRNIGAHYYQIIYPVQLRHHEKMGISTREVGAPKVRIARSSSVCSLTHFISSTKSLKIIFSTFYYQRILHFESNQHDFSRSCTVRSGIFLGRPIAITNIADKASDGPGLPPNENLL